MFAIRDYIATYDSIAYRGFAMAYTDKTYQYDWCVPEYENCDATDSTNLTLVFFIFLGSTGGLELLAIIIYRIATAKKTITL